MRHARPIALLILPACAAGCAPAPDARSRETERAPVAVTTEGQRAYDDLAAWYRDRSRVAPFEAALRGLLDADPARRESAGRYLLDLFQQAFEDGRRGRPEWRHVHPATSQAWRDAARDARELVAAPFGKTADGEAALPAALWLVEEENHPLPANRDAGLRVLRRVRSDRSAEVFRRLLAQPHPAAAVACGILEEAAARGMRELAPDVRRLCGHYRTSVREAARAAAARLDITDIPEYRPETAFTPWLEGQIRQIEDMVLTTLPTGSVWARAVASPAPGDAAPLPVSPAAPFFEYRGWILSETPEALRLLDGSGREVRIDRSRLVTLTPTPIRQEAAELLVLRRGQQAEHKALRGLLQGALDTLADEADTGKAPSDVRGPFVCIQEILVGVWCYSRSDRAIASDLLFACLDAFPDDRQLAQHAAIVVGSFDYDAMIRALTDDRDYPSARILAHHLAKPLFRGSASQDCAKELTEQLPRRQDDYRSLSLPVPDAWKRLRTGMSRRQQIAYLVDRMKLLNLPSREVSHREDPSRGFDRAQFALPDRECRRLPPGTRPPVVINPYSELAGMGLTVDDLATLAPHLANTDCMLWPRSDGHGLHHVNEPVARLVNAAAGRLLVDPEVFFDLADEDRLAEIDRIGLWAEANAGKPRAQLSREAAEEARAWEAFRFAVRALAEADAPAARAVLERRRGDFPEPRDGVEALGREIDRPREPRMNADERR